MGEQITIDRLYNTSWLKPGLASLFLIFYSPIGLLLVVIRGFILLQFMVLGVLLPASSNFRQRCLKVMSAVLGVTVSTEGETNLSQSQGDEGSSGGGGGKIFVSNNITSYDHFAIHLTTNALLPKKESVSPFIAKPFGVAPCTDLSTMSRAKLESSRASYVLFPEGENTNGELGVLSFVRPGGIDIPTGVVIQPVGIKVSRTFLNTSSISCGRKLGHEIFLLLFSPNTHFTLKFLPQHVVQEPDDDEGADADSNSAAPPPVKIPAWKTRVQAEIAKSIGLSSTKLNASDTAEYIKQLYFRPPSLTLMAREVQKKLGSQSVSPELIISTLQQTGSVEGTLESLRKSGISISSCSASPPTFSKSATQRMMTFQERKRIMIGTARQKYMEKHNLNVPI